MHFLSQIIKSLESGTRFILPGFMNFAWLFAALSCLSMDTNRKQITLQANHQQTSPASKSSRPFPNPFRIRKFWQVDFPILSYSSLNTSVRGLSVLDSYKKLSSHSTEIKKYVRRKLQRIQCCMGMEALNSKPEVSCFSLSLYSTFHTGQTNST